MSVKGSYIKFGGGGGASISTAKLMKTGQTTSYRTGDDGDLQSGRSVDFFTLAENNVFGSTDRFTDLLGTQLYDDGIVLDHSTYDGNDILGYYKFDTSVDDYANQEIAVSSLSPASFSGWRIANKKEVENIMLPVGTGVFNYSPISYPTSGSIYCSTFVDVTSMYYFIANTGACDILTTTAPFLRVFPCRDFTLTELGL